MTNGGKERKGRFWNKQDGLFYWEVSEVFFVTIE
jgi:hypothetical protein